jgi:hypothetical protein
MQPAYLHGIRNLFRRYPKKKPVRSSCAMRIKEDELHALLQFIIGISLCMTLMGTVFAVLYSLIFVVQPIDGQAPNDQEFFKLIAPIATFLTGTLSGIMLGSKSTGGKDDGPT